MAKKVEGLKVKYRLVFDGSFLFNQTSINAQLLPGPNKLAKLVYILLRFRRHPYVLGGDIKAMYMKIRVPKAYSEVLKMWYRHPSSGQLLVLKGTRHLFGLTSSPFIATATVQHHMFSVVKDPDLQQLVKEDTMVDDYLKSSDDPQFLTLLKKAEEAFLRMDMKVHKYSSNYPPLLDGVPEQDIAK